VATRITTNSGRKGSATHFVSTALACLLTAGSLAATEPRDVQKATWRQAIKQGPTVGGRIPHYLVNRQLASSYLDALRRVYRIQSCQDLFEQLGADGIDVLGNTTYTLASSDRAQQICDRAEAFTTVGGSIVWLCGTFGWLPPREATIVLIHEALHNAGLREQPHYPDGPTGNEIDQMVEQQCGF